MRGQSAIVQAGYLDTVVRHVPVPFIAARSDNSISLVNNPAKRLTGLPAIQHLDDLGILDPGLPDELRAIRAGQQRLVQTRLRDIPVELPGLGVRDSHGWRDRAALLDREPVR